MRLEWLEDILAVAQTGSFSEAAQKRHLTQSAFSRRIRTIEEHVGVPLFDRARKPIQLQATVAAQQDRIDRLASELRQLVFDLQRGAGLAANRLVFASQHALTTSLTPDLLRWIDARAPSLYVRLRSANQADCLGLVLSRQADLAFVYGVPGMGPPLEADYVETLTLGQDRLIPVFSAAQAEALNARFRGGELPVVAYPGAVFLGEVMDRRILPGVRRTVRPAPKAETALTLAALELAQAGVGVAWVPASLARTPLQDGHLVELSSSLPGATLDVLALRIAGGHGEAQRLIWDHLGTISDALAG